MPKFQQPKPSQRRAWLLNGQNLKMAQSAHAYVRGNTAKFYEWLEKAEGTVPDGPAIWICGDCHVGNLGPVANADGDVEILDKNVYIATVSEGGKLDMGYVISIKRLSATRRMI